MKVLIVVDSKAMRMIVRRTLRQANVETADPAEAGNGTEALDAVNTDQPDLILCDWNMPEMNGIEFLRALRADGNQVRFGFVTSEGTAEMRAEALAAGAQFIITKPFTPEKFGAAIENEDA